MIKKISSFWRIIIKNNCYCKRVITAKTKINNKFSRQILFLYCYPFQPSYTMVYNLMLISYHFKHYYPSTFYHYLLGDLSHWTNMLWNLLAREIQVNYQHHPAFWEGLPLFNIAYFLIFNNITAILLFYFHLLILFSIFEKSLSNKYLFKFYNLTEWVGTSINARCIHF